jgi:RimJ/RimL family protein N-acetyltransferase
MNSSTALPVSRLIIETPRLRIRNLQPGDLPAFHEYRSDPTVTRYQGFDVFSIDQAAAFIEAHSQKEFGKAGEWVQYGIETRPAAIFIGDCAIKLDGNDVRLAEVGITVSPAHQRKGYAKEALAGILDYLFSIDGFHRVTETVDAENIASIQLMKSLGFREEGYFLENSFFKGRWSSEYQYAMLKREWNDRCM